MGQSSYLANIRFLIVDDNSFMRGILRRILDTLGVNEINEAANGEEALETLKKWPADIVLLDWEMTPFNGIEFTKMVRNSHDSSKAFEPIIMISAHSEYWRISAARDAGVTEFLVKPISVKALFSRIQNVIENPRPFVNAPGFFGPDRRRHEVNHQQERREHDPDQISPDLVMSQDEINDFFSTHPNDPAHMPSYTPATPLKSDASDDKAPDTTS
ncbi:response regulator [Magnetovibrio blakemorei]|uniref:Response regulatory domain-containing protein n=1 Tax=Magnetovibrio blakemorei TaxID=28181 RepID=A0A1E5QB46_9PROT|nr:response regulator [Magnetovibrio blakemorei]OEJ69171.1 hypothetical protein BEN30_03475 [Magnetovibrio blakemorei]